MTKRYIPAAGTFGLLLALAAPATAQTQLQFNGNTTGQPGYNRVNSGIPPTSLSGGSTAFQAFHFRVRGTGSYQFDTTVGTLSDTFITLYGGKFAPGSPLVGALAANDDAIGLSSRLAVPLTAARQYTFVTTSFAGGQSGTYLFTLAGPGAIVLSDAEVATASLQSGQAATRSFLDIVNLNAGYAMAGTVTPDRVPAGMMLLGMKDGGSAALPVPSRIQVWAQGFGGYETISGGSSGASTYSNRGRGLAFGADVRLAPGLAVGVAGAVGSSNYRVRDIDGSGESTNYRVAAYAGWQSRTLYLTGSLGYGRDNVETSRSLGFSPVVGSTDIDEFLGHVEAGAKLPIGGTMVVTPFVGFQFGRQSLDAFAETSGASGLMPLAIAGQSDWWSQSLLGARFSKVWDIGGAKLQHTTSLAWVHNFSDTSTVRASIVGAPTFISTVDGAARAEDLLRVSTGVGIDLSASTKLSLSYRGEFGSDTRDQAGHINLSVRW